VPRGRKALTAVEKRVDVIGEQLTLAATTQRRCWRHWPGKRIFTGAVPLQRGAIVIPDADEPVSFETDVKPLFRERDRESMQSHFDLWSHDDVSQHTDAILARLQAGTMPCDGA
jgi:hypothetical protein